MRNFVMVILTILLLFCVNGVLFDVSKVQATAASTDGQDFEGDWIVSGYQEGDAVTSRYDGTVVSISRNGMIFLLDGPTNDEYSTQFRQVGNKLEGVYIPNFSQLKVNFPTVSDRVLQQAVASGKIFYNINLTMGEDGRIHVERDNIELFFVHNIVMSTFDHVVQYPGWCKYTLIKKGADVNNTNTTVNNHESLSTTRERLMRQ